MRRRTICLIVVLLILASGVGTVALIELTSSHASDSVMIKKFLEHEADFNLLVKMANEDSSASFINASKVVLESKGAWPHTIYLDEDIVWPPSGSVLGFSRRRWDEYRRLFKKLSLHSIDHKREMPEAVFITASIDFPDWSEDGIEVTEKGYLYSARGIYNSLTGSLDGVKINRPATFYKMLNDHDHWYLFYEWSFVKPE